MLSGCPFRSSKTTDENSKTKVLKKSTFWGHSILVLTWSCHLEWDEISKKGTQVLTCSDIRLSSEEPRLRRLWKTWSFVAMPLCCTFVANKYLFLNCNFGVVWHCQKTKNNPFLRGGFLWGFKHLRFWLLGWLSICRMTKFDSGKDRIPSFTKTQLETYRSSPHGCSGL